MSAPWGVGGVAGTGGGSLGGAGSITAAGGASENRPDGGFPPRPVALRSPELGVMDHFWAALRQSSRVWALLKQWTHLNLERIQAVCL
jgi:hypothetical protein